MTIPFFYHLKEFKFRLFYIMLTWSFLVPVLYYFGDPLLLLLIRPKASFLKNSEQAYFIFTNITEAFQTYLEIALYFSTFICLPVLLYHLLIFIIPGLYKYEKKALLPYLIATPTLFLLGGMLVYYLIMPLAIKFFLSFETSANIGNLPIQLEAKVNEYLSLIMRLIFAFGISFQLPILLSLLARVGFIDSQYLKKRRKYVVVIIFALAAVLTPPDPITQIGL